MGSFVDGGITTQQESQRECARASLSKSNHGRRRGGAFCFGDAEGQMIGVWILNSRANGPLWIALMQTRKHPQGQTRQRSSVLKTPLSYSPYSTHGTRDTLQHPQHPITHRALLFLLFLNRVLLFDRDRPCSHSIGAWLGN